MIKKLLLASLLFCSVAPALAEHHHCKPSKVKAAFKIIAGAWLWVPIIAQHLDLDKEEWAKKFFITSLPVATASGWLITEGIQELKEAHEDGE